MHTPPRGRPGVAGFITAAFSLHFWETEEAPVCVEALRWLSTGPVALTASAGAFVFLKGGLVPDKKFRLWYKHLGDAPRIRGVWNEFSVSKKSWLPAHR
jgi:hypothetical protein